VDDVSWTLTRGVWGLLGANGAGKTTLMRMICGILSPTEGRVLYDSLPTSSLGEAYRSILGYLPQDFGFYPEFTVAGYLHYVASLKGLTRREANAKMAELLDMLGLSEVRNKLIRKLSGGMRRRVGIAQALLNDPELLILDEPTSGLDPGERVHFRNILSTLGRERIVLISTHIVHDVEYIATRNAMMKGGKLIATGTPAELAAAIDGKVWSSHIPEAVFARHEKNACVVQAHHEDNGEVTVRYVADTPVWPDSQAATPRLEDLYLWLFRENEEGRRAGI
jgi:ABC-2 type transport system ATP-binding protein